jgi:DNA polymerase-3 subunit beta
MRFDCPRKELSDAVNMALSASSTRTSLPIYQSLKVEATDAEVRVLGCDGELWIERRFAAMVSEPGAVCLQAKTLGDIVHSLSDGAIELKTLEGNGALLTQSGSEYRLQTLDAGDFPEPPSFGGDGELTIPMGSLRGAIDSVSYAVSTDPHRGPITGVLFNYNGTKLQLVATDAHRLAVRELEQPGSGGALSAVVPEKALRAIKAVPLTDDQNAVLRFGNGRLGIEAAGARVVSNLLSGTFPNWERVVPTESTRKWSVEVDQLNEKVKRAMILARDNANRIRFKGDGDQILISARSEEKGEAKEEVPMVAEDGNVEIAFNGKYVQDALSAIPTDGVEIEMTESTRPAVFRPAEKGEGYFCVIMPMQLS